MVLAKTVNGGPAFTPLPPSPPPLPPSPPPAPRAGFDENLHRDAKRRRAKHAEELSVDPICRVRPVLLSTHRRLLFSLIISQLSCARCILGAQKGSLKQTRH